MMPLCHQFQALQLLCIQSELRRLNCNWQLLIQSRVKLLFKTWRPRQPSQNPFPLLRQTCTLLLFTHRHYRSHNFSRNLSHSLKYNLNQPLPPILTQSLLSTHHNTQTFRIRIPHISMIWRNRKITRTLPSFLALLEHPFASFWFVFVVCGCIIVALIILRYEMWQKCQARSKQII